MPDPHRVELTVPVAEDDLLAFLLSRYPAQELERVGIHHSNSVIRDFQVAPDGKCNFRVSVITGINAEQVIEAGQAAKNETEDLGAQELQEPQTHGAEDCLDCGADMPTNPEEVACPVQRLQALRVKKSKK